MSQARGSLRKQEGIEHPLLYGEYGGRVRKPIDYVRHYMPDFRADLESGDLIMITDPNRDVKFYMVDPTSKPLYMPERTIVVSTKWATPIPVLVGNVAPTTAQFEITDMASASYEIGVWKVYAKSGGFRFTIDQPALQNPIFTDGTHTVWMDYGNTGANVVKKEWGAVPEVVTFENELPVFLNVASMNMNSTNHMGYIGFRGYRYKLVKVKVPDPSDEPRVVKTIQLGPLK
jgi:hypothetical protein